jgi:hypothetical protein
MSHYYGKRSFSPLLISPNIDQTKRILNVHVVSDLPNLTINDTIEITVFSYDDLKVKLVKKIDFTVGPLNTTNALEWSLDSIKAESGCEYNVSKSCLIKFSFLKNSQYSDGENSIFLNNFFHTVENLVVPKIDIVNIEKVGASDFNIRINTSNVALFVWLDLETTEFVGRFENNGFHMTTEQMDVKLYVQNPSVTVDLIKAKLRVRSLILYEEQISSKAHFINNSKILILSILTFLVIYKSF